MEPEVLSSSVLIKNETDIKIEPEFMALPDEIEMNYSSESLAKFEKDPLSLDEDYRNEITDEEIRQYDNTVKHNIESHHIVSEKGFGERMLEGNSILVSKKGQNSISSLGNLRNSVSSERSGKPFIKIHQRIHTGEKPFTCNECHKAFHYAWALKRHFRVHTGEKPYTCNECQKSFTQAGDLKKHLRIHTGEKPYTCNECQKSFSCAGGLGQHLRTHIGDKSFSCNECQKTFSQSEYLKRHKRIHIKKPNRCSVCKKEFNNFGNLKTHEMLHQGIRMITPANVNM